MKNTESFYCGRKNTAEGEYRGNKDSGRMNIAFEGHSVIKPESIKGLRDLGNCLAQLLRLRVEKIKALTE